MLCLDRLGLLEIPSKVLRNEEQPQPAARQGLAQFSSVIINTVCVRRFPCRWNPWVGSAVTISHTPPTVLALGRWLPRVFSLARSDIGDDGSVTTVHLLVLADSKLHLSRITVRSLAFSFSLLLFLFPFSFFLFFSWRRGETMDRRDGTPSRCR